ncbi:hypothetical protein [Methylophilus medardicus]|uniref:Low-complexity protein n=1 Tax=Methylophilus medardicus TaxID=2588534 RepID=A0A5B8CQE5_9PROT|nr:hypothetical protein [Methylophilus medardicus]QDC43478.1 hypothetical protein FIU01_02340 [Methylophilus medardicus]QDC48485.1 hypothetical protein FIU00_02340 [Methylophilus medardicus]QDC52190.1 hypothetical protein FIT99_02340 [Methylophilus medardicus]
MTTHKMTFISGAIALSIAAAAAQAGNNPFELKTLAQGYQVADATDAKGKEGKCGSGKCGANMKKMKDSNGGADKMKEGSCHHEKAKEGSCSADKMKEGSCSAEKMKEGSCHANK